MSIGQSNVASFTQTPVISTRPDGESLYHKCLALANNLWWSWNPEVINLFRELDPVRWRQLDHNPVALLREFTPERIQSRAAEMVLYSRINHAYRQLKTYLTDTSQTWAAKEAGVLGAHPVAYFSAEFGIHESLPIYSGGLGVLSGDHIKSASNLGVPLVAIGLFYDQGYFRQRLNDDGFQQEEYLETQVENLPWQPVQQRDGSQLIVKIDTRQAPIYAQVWLMRVGRVRLYLLDCDVDGNTPEDRSLTSRLYGGDERTRIRQELVLGVGGVRVLNAIGISPGVYHLNEGHSAFAPLEVIRERIHEDGLSFDDALREVAQRTVFTTHTPVPAGHDRFSGEMIEEHLGPLRDQLGISYEQLVSFGRVEPTNQSEPCCMTVLGLKLSRRANAVSALHGQVSRRMWAQLWPWRSEEEIPIGHITNGVHIESWLAWQMEHLFDRHFPNGWLEHSGKAEVWQNIYRVDPGELWETHNVMKNRLFSFMRRRISRQCRRRGETDDVIDSARSLLDPNVLTIGFARRFATYKRADLILSDMDRLRSICNNSQYPVQFIFAGKAHPKDQPGKELIQSIANLRHDEDFKDRIVFIEDYDINVARHMVQGVDVWLNNPRRPLEASGTSGQKVTLNGGLNLSVLDGWWAEAYDGSNGFAIGKGRSHANDRINDERDAEYLYETLENRVIPMFYDRDIDGLPREWIRFMMNSIATCAWRYSSDRMVMDYTRAMYVPAGGGVSCEVRMAR